MVELPDGSVLTAIRNTHWYHCHCRMRSYSYDGAETFQYEDIFFNEDLQDPNVCGAIIFHGGNLWIHMAGIVTVYLGPSAYPCFDFNRLQSYWTGL